MMQTKSSKKPLLYTVKQAAERLSISRVTLYRRLRSGEINAVKNGRLTYISPAELERYVTELRPWRPGVGR
ncbi:helix-turn-helix domain-containing protein [Oleiagrimonas sp. C23AA]|nr:helix-turn-helix domain-containing protein [Oleiagrimonas sp. C23AA]